MKQMFIKTGVLLSLCFISISFMNNVWAQSITKKNTKKISNNQIAGTRILFMTDSGTMVIRLYDSTPLHRDNFITKIKEGFYDSLLFHRVIKGFMIQGGDPNSKYAAAGTLLGEGEAAGDKIPAEFKPYLFHKKGALAAARDDNPEKASSNCQFYIVQGKQYTDAGLDSVEQKYKRQIPIDQRKIYKTTGGTPSLDQRYTVFGEVETGMEVIDKIANTHTDAADRPVTDIRMSISILNKLQKEKYKRILKNK